MTEGHEAVSGLAGLLGDVAVWYGAAVLIFFIIFFMFAGKPIVALLDGQIEKIKNELEQAKKLREEAAATLEEYKNKQKEAIKEAEAIVRQAKEEAAKLQIEAEKELKVSLEIHEQKAKQIMDQLGVDAIAEVRSAIIDQAVSAAVSALKAGMNEDMAAKLIEQAISEVPKLKDVNKVA